MFSKFASGAAVAALFAVGLAPCAANAAVTTYHYAETRFDGNLSSGVIGDAVHNPYYYSPFTFDFTVANALAANSTYNFGVTGVENGESGNVLDLQASDGNALTTFTLADYHAHFDVYGGSVGHSLSRLHLETNAAGAISTFAINIQGRSAFNAQYIFNFSMQGTPAATAGLGIALYYDPALFFRTTVAGDVRCVIFCGGTFTSAAGGIGGAGGPGGGAGGGVPEPASWALMIAGFGGVGAVLRRRTVRAA